jgi:hypothetical protein
VQLVNWQQGSPTSPHWQVPPTQVLSAAQTPPEQQGWNSEPHCTHDPAMQSELTGMHELPPQQRWPTLPHAAQAPPSQPSPLEQLLPPQHACPSPPHWHVPATHV